ncbi:hypothetical protein CHU98_g1985 [Xylaria longipes]|nr:hypothetical protein CHU98_g1985 [Xylaria longipes]
MPASQLHNLYEFFKEAGDEHVDVFFSRADGTEFTRDDVVKTFEHILLGYGIQVLLKCLRDATDAAVEKFQKYFDDHGQPLPRADGYYSHGQMPLSARSIKA